MITDGVARLDGMIAASVVHGILQQLPGLTRGAGAMECAFDHYAPATGEFRIRQRSGLDPFDRTGYLIGLHRAPK